MTGSRHLAVALVLLVAFLLLGPGCNELVAYGDADILANAIYLDIVYVQ